MRRCLHASLVGILTLSLSMDAARGCWYLRHGGRSRGCVVASCPPPAIAAGWVGAAAWEGCGPAVVVTDAVVMVDVVADVALVEGIVADDPACSCGEGHTVVVPSPQEAVEWSAAAAPAEHVTATGPSVPLPTIAEPIASPAAAVAEKPADVADSVPDLKPAGETTQADVRQTGAIGESVMTPAVEAVPAVVPPPATEEAAPMPPPESPVAAPEVREEPAEEPPPVRKNIFEEVENEETPPAVDVVPMPAADEATPPAVGDDAAAGAADAAASPSETVEPPPAAESAPPAESSPPLENEPAAAADSAAQGAAPAEPTRRWIDRSGGYALVGTLRAVRDDGTCVIASRGRTIAVPLRALSDFDRDYASRAAGRLASASGPEHGDTAGL